MAKTDASADVATTDESLFTVEEPQTWWHDETADEVEGYDLLRGEGLYELAGVPFAAFKVIYRDGIQRKGADYRDDYVSVEVRVAPSVIYFRDATRIKSRRTAMNLPDATPVANPDEQLVTNDGSTGIYRQITAYLHDKGLIKLPDGPTTGEKGECIYDLPRSQWLEGADEATKGIDINMRCSRGLRFSDYENTYTSEGRTWYIA